MYFRNVTSSVVQDALNVWSEIWGELEGDVACGAAVTSEDSKGFTPSCGWPAFLEKMWVLRQNLDFLARFSRQ
jgi:peptide methionine sulfoxide reductase MsrB